MGPESTGFSCNFWNFRATAPFSRKAPSSGESSELQNRTTAIIWRTRAKKNARGGARPPQSAEARVNPDDRDHKHGFETEPGGEPARQRHRDRGGHDVRGQHPRNLISAAIWGSHSSWSTTCSIFPHGRPSSARASATIFAEAKSPCRSSSLSRAAMRKSGRLGGAPSKTC